MYSLKNVTKELRKERLKLSVRLARIGEALTVLDPLINGVKKHRNNLIFMPKRKISAAGRKRISIAQKKRWKAYKRKAA